MSSYGASYLFVGWSRPEQIEEALSKLLDQPTSLPHPTEDDLNYSFCNSSEEEEEDYEDDFGEAEQAKQANTSA